MGFKHTLPYGSGTCSLLDIWHSQGSNMNEQEYKRRSKALVRRGALLGGIVIIGVGSACCAFALFNSAALVAVVIFCFIILIFGMAFSMQREIIELFDAAHKNSWSYSPSGPRILRTLGMHPLVRQLLRSIRIILGLFWGQDHK